VNPGRRRAAVAVRRSACGADQRVGRDRRATIGRNTTRVRWLLRQLTDAPDSLRIDAYALNSRSNMSALLRDVRENTDVLIEDRTRELRRYVLHLAEPMGTKRGNSRGSFIASMIDLVDHFYTQVVQCLRPWTPPAPQMRKPQQVTTDAH
jgi:hypothetical protein